MSYTLTFNGNNYVLPDVNEVGWGNNVNSYFIAIAAGCLQKTGGSFTLSAETDFGAGFGLKSLYYKSRSSNPAGSGIVRLSNNGDAISWRNALNSADLPLIVTSGDRLQFNGNVILDAAGTGLTQTTDTVSLTVPVVVSSGGTGDTSLTAYAVLCGGTTSTGAVQPIASVGSSGQVLTSNGAGTLPTFQNVAGTGTVNSGTAGRLSLYPSSTNAVSDTYVQNGHNIILAIATQATRSANLTLTIPNPGDAVTAANFTLDQGATSPAGAWSFTNSITTLFNDSAKLALTRPSNSRTGSISIVDPQGGLEFHAGLNGGGETSLTAFEFSTDAPSAETIVLSILGAGQLQAVDGSASVPTYSFLNDTDCGLYRIGTDDIAIVTNGIKALEINATQQIDIPNTKQTVGGNQVYPITNIVQSTSITAFTTTSMGFQTTNLTASITPKFSTSKILIQISGTLLNAGTNAAYLTIFRGVSNLSVGGNFAFVSLINANGTTTRTPASIVFYDSPATTSSITYSVKLSSGDGTSTVGFGAGDTQVMTLTEIAQ